MTESQRRWCNRGLLIWAYLNVFFAVMNILVTHRYRVAMICLLAAWGINYIRRKDFTPVARGGFKA